MKSKIRFLISITILFSLNVNCQVESGFYMNWNTDHTRRGVKPSIKLSSDEAKIINCYKITFDSNEKLTRVEYFVSGNKSSNSNYGSHIMEVQYFPNHYEEFFRNKENKRIVNENGIWLHKYILNEDGFWIRKENYDKQGELKDQYGIAISKVQRDYQNRRVSEIQLNANFDTIPDPNGFKVTHFTYNNDGFISSRQNINDNGLLENGKYGYAKVIFHIDQNGQFYGEEFIDNRGKLTNSSSLGYAKIDMRDFNKFGRNRRFYFTDESGYPAIEKAMGIITYNDNMTKNEIVYYDRYGIQTLDAKVRAKSKYIYDENGEYVKRENYNCLGEIME